MIVRLKLSLLILPTEAEAATTDQQRDEPHCAGRAPDLPFPH
jgi:hypothetical protein